MPNYSLKKWKEIVDAFCNKYSGLTNWWDAMILQVERGHDIITPSKRRLSFGMYYNESSGVYEYSKPQIKNYPVQSFSSDCMYVCMHNIYSQLVKYKFKSKMICQVHDSIVYDFVEKEESNLVEINLNIMNNLDKYISDYYSIEYNVPMGGDIEIGSNYGDLKPIN